MPRRLLECSLITPEGALFTGPAHAVYFPAVDGEMAILYHRAPLMCRLGAGRLRIRSPEMDQNWFVAEGFLQVLDNQVIILTQEAFEPGQIDMAEARSLLREIQMMPTFDEEAQHRKATIEETARARLRFAGG